ncbi:MAG: hypothetical protein RSE52_07790 [Erysipelotrichaceae bacterium]
MRVFSSLCVCKKCYPEHQPNEKVKIEQMMLSAQIYKEALKRCVMK